MNAAKRILLLVLQPDLEAQSEFISVLTRIHLTPEVKFVASETELLEYLNKAKNEENKQQYPLPGIILLSMEIESDLTCGLIEKIKVEYLLSHIPIILMCKDFSHKNLVKAYDYGANSVIRNPVRFDSLVELMSVFDDYWFGCVQLP